MEDYYGKGSIQKVLNGALIFQILYVFSIGIVNVVPRPFIKFIGIAFDYERRIDLICVIGTILTIALFLLFYFLFQSKLKEKKKAGTGFTILIGIFTIINYYVIPEIAAMIQRYSLIKDLENKVISGETYTMLIGLQSIESIMKIWLFVAVVLFVCAWGMYWFGIRYGLIKMKES